MALQQTIHDSLQHRINEYLRGKPVTYVVEEFDEEAAEAIFEMLQKAQEDLKAAQERVERLKWELARAQS